MGALISVIIPNRDGRDIIGACLDALEAQTLRPDEIIVVDDCSSDGSQDYVEKNYPNVRVVRLDKNVGFAGAVNAGLKESTGEWVALINSDALVEKDWVAEILSAIRLCPWAGSIASRVLAAGPTGVIDSMGIKVDPSGLALLVGRGLPDKEARPGDKLFVVFGPAGSAAVYNRAMIGDVGFMEEDFFCYYEDVDLAFRARWKGWKCVLANKARVVHKHSYTSDKVGVEKRYFLQRNRLRTIVRNWPLHCIMRRLHIIALYDMAGFVLAVKEGNGSQAVRARVDFFKGLKKDLAARRKILDGGIAADSSLSKWLGMDLRPVDLDTLVKLQKESVKDKIKNVFLPAPPKDESP